MTYSRGSCAPRGDMTTLETVRAFGHVPHHIRAILRSFLISYFSAVLLMFSLTLLSIFQFSCGVQWNLLVDPLHGIPVSYCLSYGPFISFSKVSFASLISQSGSFALPAVMGCTGIAVYSGYNGLYASEPEVTNLSIIVGPTIALPKFGNLSTKGRPCLWP